ncbi:unnamed protein product [Dovyalis caffra]|uniref:Uncharacterized protein n=1 Tax=Dovyalis caffra TaxID=77055 RepID=A0AAV1S492_9ROSI|nr:unnamed protein product [Dovyalis caffra]
MAFKDLRCPSPHDAVLLLQLSLASKRSTLTGEGREVVRECLGWRQKGKFGWGRYWSDRMNYEIGVAQVTTILGPSIPSLAQAQLID